MKVRKKFLIWALVLLALFWLLTGGIVVFSFDRVLPEVSRSNYRPLIVGTVTGKGSSWGVPFLYAFETCNKPPYSLHFSYITHNIIEGTSIEVERMLLVYEDGGHRDLTHQMPRNLIPRLTEHSYRDEAGSLQKKPCLRADVVIPDCIRECKPFELRVLYALKGKGIVFEEGEYFIQYKCYPDTDVFTTWWWLIKSQAG